MRMVKRNVLYAGMALCAALFFSLPGGAQDIVRLKNGEKIEGKIKQIKRNKVFCYKNKFRKKKIKLIKVDTIISETLWLQNFPRNKYGMVEYEEIIQLPGASQKDIFNAAKVWFAYNFGDSKAVLRIVDEDDGIIIGAGNTDVNYRAWGIVVSTRVDFFITLHVKEGRYRFRINRIGTKNKELGFIPIGDSFPHFKDGYKNISPAGIRLKEQAMSAMEGLKLFIKLGILKELEELKW